MPDIIRVMISSTSHDLPEHRNEVRDACLRLGFFPLMMEYLPASDDDAIRASLRMVEEADLYLGIFAYRYGYVPAKHDISITEMEYNYAVKLDKPRLIFVMHEDHPVRASDVETGAGKAKMDAFKEHLLASSVVNFFRSPADLRAQVLHSLSEWRERASPSAQKASSQYHEGKETLWADRDDRYSSLAPKEPKPEDIIIPEQSTERPELAAPPKETKQKPKIGGEDEVDLFLQLYEPRLLAEIDRLAQSRDRGGYVTRDEIWDGTKTGLFQNQPKEFAIRVIERMIGKRLLIDRSGSIQLHPQAYAYLQQ